MVKVVALKDFISPVHGNVQFGDVFTMQSEEIAQGMQKAGLIKIITPEKLPEIAQEDDIEAIKSELRDLGVAFHPRTGKDKLIQLLKDAKDDDTSEVAGY